MQARREVQWEAERLAQAEAKKQTKCGTCKRAFPSNVGLMGHLKSTGHSNPEVRSAQRFQKACTAELLACKICSVEFSTRKQLNDHIMLNDHLKRPTCKKCGAGFQTRDQLFSHLQAEGHFIKIKLEPDIEAEESKTASSLDVPYNELHNDDLPFSSEYTD
jgi:hypothetical protein